MRRHFVILLASACLPFWGGVAAARDKPRADALPATRIQELHYGDVLFLSLIHI